AARSRSASPRSSTAPASTIRSRPRRFPSRAWRKSTRSRGRRRSARCAARARAVRRSSPAAGRGRSSRARDMRSMTGFGAGSVATDALALRAELRSVNHKFLQLKVRLPSELAFLEADVEELVRGRLERGAVVLNVTSHGAAALAPVELNLAVAR